MLAYEVVIREKFDMSAENVILKYFVKFKNEILFECDKVDLIFNLTDIWLGLLDAATQCLLAGVYNIQACSSELSWL